MNISNYLHDTLKDIAPTYPLNAPLDTDMPFITYTLDSSEDIKSISRVVAVQNFVTIEAFESEYDDAQALLIDIVDALSCNKDSSIIGATLQSTSSSYDSEPIDKYSVSLEYSIYIQGN